MKNGKRVIAGLLAVVMMISSVQVAAYAAEEEAVVKENETAVEEEQTEVVKEQDNETEIVEVQTVAAEISENDANDAGETDKVSTETVGNIVDDEDVIDGEEIVDNEDTGVIKDEIVDNEEIIIEVETVVSEDTTEQVSDEDVVEAEVEELDADLSASNSVDYDAVEKYVHDQLLTKRRQNPNAETITIDVSSYRIPYATDADKQKIIEICTTMRGCFDLYFLKNKFSASQLSNILISMTFNIDTEMDDAAFQKAVNDALSNVNDNMSDFQKIVILHDWLALHCEYKLTDDVERTAYAALVTRKSVCQGYALAYRNLLDRVGIENYLISCEGMNHAWNLIKLDGEYYHVDVSTDSCISSVRHKLLLVSEEFLRNTCNWHYDWQVTTNWQNSFDLKATSTLYDNASW